MNLSFVIFDWSFSIGIWCFSCDFRIVAWWFLPVWRTTSVVCSARSNRRTPRSKHLMGMLFSNSRYILINWMTPFRHPLPFSRCERTWNLCGRRCPAATWNFPPNVRTWRWITTVENQGNELTQFLVHMGSGLDSMGTYATGFWSCTMKLPRDKLLRSYRCEFSWGCTCHFCSGSMGQAWENTADP